jgi:hypothetical protein
MTHASPFLYTWWDTGGAITHTMIRYVGIRQIHLFTDAYHLVRTFILIMPYQL